MSSYSLEPIRLQLLPQFECALQALNGGVLFLSALIARAPFQLALTHSLPYWGWSVAALILGTFGGAYIGSMLTPMLAAKLAFGLVLGSLWHAIVVLDECLML